MTQNNTYNNRKYYWLKLDRHFFNNARIKKLRRLAGGDTYTIIYLKLMLLSIEFNGLLIYEGIEENFEKEMALKLEENEEDVKMTLIYLKNQGLLEEKGEDFLLPEAMKSIGSETQSNVYKRNKKLELFQQHSNNIPIEIEKEIDKDKEDIDNIYIEHGPIENSPLQEPKKEEKVIITIVLNDNSEYEITETMINEWQPLFQAIDVLTELRKMKAWCIANVQKRKTKKGINRFIVNWLSKAQDKGGNYSNILNTQNIPATQTTKSYRR